jgi:squalene-associated FAD-dependent desaturase
MSSQKSVTVIGGGAAGLSAAVFLANKDFKVTLIEASPKLGGRAYSFFDKTIDATIDNGQHILASWYHNTFDFLEIIGSNDKLTLQKQLEVKFIDNQANQYRFKAASLPPPFHLMVGIMKYGALGFKDQRAVGIMVHAIEKNEIADEKLKQINTDELFKLTKQTDKSINNFWKPFIIAVFNAEPEHTSAYLFSKIVKTGFVEKGGSNLVLPNSFLDDLYVKPAMDYLKSKNAEVIINSKASKINFDDSRVSSIILEDGREIKSDFYISAVAFFDLKNLVGESVYNREFSNVSGLKPSPIANIHLKFDRSIDDLFSEQFAGLLNTKTQWIFKVKNDQLCLVISAAREIAEMDKDGILKIAQDELEMCIPEFKNVRITGSRVIKEMRATFVPDSESLKLRPKNTTSFKNFFIAGDWTDTGLPATIEGAVKSSANCVNEIIKQLKP